MTPLERPGRLRPGDRIAVVAPSGPAPPEHLERGLDVLREWGLEPVPMPHVLDAHPELSFLAGADADRAADFQAAWTDPSIAAIICARGGYGSQRMIDLVDWSPLARVEPKVFIGFSDITAMHEVIALRLGLATIHGPMPAWSGFFEHSESQEHLRRTLFEPELAQKLTPASSRPLVSGQAVGITFGGNVSLLAAGIGAAEARPDSEGGILVLEDTGEDAYRLDRFLTQLRRSGWLDGVVGVVAGSWDSPAAEPDMRAVLLDRLGDWGFPMVDDFGFGHCKPTLTIPLGVPARLDADAGTLAFEVPALR